MKQSASIFWSIIVIVLCIGVYLCVSSMKPAPKTIEQHGLYVGCQVDVHDWNVPYKLERVPLGSGGPARAFVRAIDASGVELEFGTQRIWLNWQWIAEVTVSQRAESQR